MLDYQSRKVDSVVPLPNGWQAVVRVSFSLQVSSVHVSPSVCLFPRVVNQTFPVTTVLDYQKGLNRQCCPFLQTVYRQLSVFSSLSVVCSVDLLNWFSVGTARMTSCVGRTLSFVLRKYWLLFYLLRRKGLLQ